MCFQDLEYALISQYGTPSADRQSPGSSSQRAGGSGEDYTVGLIIAHHTQPAGQPRQPGLLDSERMSLR